jgi:simple sugar transport system ATP-binding protein
LKFRGRDITELETPDRRKLGIAVVPEDRLAEGIIPQMTLRDNLILGNHERFSGALGLDRQEMDSFAQVLMRTFDIRADGCMQSVGSLSGGNQQKAVLARELSGNPDLLIAAQPSRGLDLNAKAFVHSQLRQVSSRNGAVLLISGDLEELMELSHRIAVLFRGKIVGEQDRENFKVSELGRMMTGRPEAPYERL